MEFYKTVKLKAESAYLYKIQAGFLKLVNLK